MVHHCSGCPRSQDGAHLAVAEQAGERVVASPADHGLRCSFWLWEQLEAPAGVFTVSLCAGL